MPCSKIIATAEQLKEVIARLSKEISSDHHDLENWLAVVVLEGARTFAQDLLAKLDLPIETAYIKVTSYRGTESNGKVAIDADNGRIKRIKDKNILLIDDIYDTGLTLSAIIEWLNACGAKSIQTCVLLKKQIQHKRDIEIDYLGMTVEDNFVVGYGLDFNDIYRNLPYIGILSGKTLKKHSTAYKL